MVALNLIYVLTCAPVITIGAATSALTETMNAVRADPDTDMLRTYVGALKADKVRGTVVFWPLCLATVLAVFVSRFWWSVGGTVGVVSSALASLMALYLSASTVHSMLLVASRQAPALRTIRNALLLPAVSPGRALLLVLVPVTEAAMVMAVPPSLVLLLTVGLAIGALLQVVIAAPLYARLS
nr:MULTISPECIES: YesL family protein [unclassified Actinomyces]